MSNINSRGVILFDIDGTILDPRSFFDMLDYFITHNVTFPVVKETSDSLLRKFRVSEITYEDGVNQLYTVWAGSLKGMEYSKILDVACRYFEEHRQYFFPYFIDIVESLKSEYDIYLVTSNAQFMSEAIVKNFSLKGSLSTVFEMQDGVFTGEIGLNLTKGKAPVEQILSGYSPEKSVAFGNSGNDVAMLDMVNKPFCINPDGDLCSLASERNWVVISKENAEAIIREKLGLHSFSHIERMAS